MNKQKPSLARGTRDFGPDKMAKRNYILNTIKAVFQKYGYDELQTPAIENLSTLMGKYGDEGDQLLFKILNSGNFSEKITAADLEQGHKSLTHKISEKGLRYDLTVPFARYVSMNRGEISFPFRRYQIQPVWRADRPQKGRYREFYQCDADVVGTKSLVCEAEIIAMLQEVFVELGLEIIIKINNRKVLGGIAEIVGAKGKEADLAVAIDKLDKIGKEGVLAELAEKGFDENMLQKLMPLLDFEGNNLQKLDFLRDLLQDSSQGTLGYNELDSTLKLAVKYGLSLDNIEIDITLARGLSYYTGAIFEVKAMHVQMGSISGGGRYDNLTDLFGLPDVSGVGISFGVDRIYDVLDELNLYPSFSQSSTQILITNFDENSFDVSFSLLKTLRNQGFKAEIYPDMAKLKKQFEYAGKRNIPYVVVIGADELANGKLSLKNMQNGEQQTLTAEELILLLVALGN